MGVTDTDTENVFTVRAAVAVTPFATAETVEVPVGADPDTVTVDRKVPSLWVTPTAGEKVSEDEDEVNDTDLPAFATPLPSRTVTMAVVVSPAATVAGDNETRTESADVAKAGVVDTATKAGTAIAVALSTVRREGVGGSIRGAWSVADVMGAPSGQDASCTDRR
ncbi:hypothetical protein HR12_11120 [Microbacterium sp. SUBG005]|nr:hypothetical protein HR12_11120 [Microbacterium sp. SUBG005]